MPSVEILNSHTLSTLRKEVSKSNKELGLIQSYKKGMNKSKLIELMMKHKERFDHIKMKPKKGMKTHTMPSGDIHTGEKHTKDSKLVKKASKKAPKKAPKKTETIEFVAKNPPPVHDVKFEAKPKSVAKPKAAPKQTIAQKIGVDKPKQTIAQKLGVDKPKEKPLTAWTKYVIKMGGVRKASAAMGGYPDFKKSLEK